MHAPARSLPSQRRAPSELSSLAISRDVSPDIPLVRRHSSEQMLYDDDEEEAVDEDDEVDEEGAVAVAYGEGLAVLLGHLAATRRPQVQAWLQLKEDLVASDAAALQIEQGWDDLDDLEADFIVTNAQHLGKSWLTC